MDEMRRILGVLRQDEGAEARAPAPTLSMLPALIEADPGLPVTLRLDGDLDAISPSIELHAYRIVQEALTNARRHAGRVGSVVVTVARRGDSLEVEVTDDGRGATTLVEGSGEGGHGLSGMRERVLAAGGRLTAGPRQGGGWRVHALFPLEPATRVEPILTSSS
jgi:signal transduction histidine kinase